jgi:hypothetical protein
VESTEDFKMRTGTAFVTTLFALASFPLLAQQPPPTNQTPPSSPAASAPALEMSPVNGELMSKLDSKTAKTGDSVVVQTKTTVKTADGTEIPKGSKLVGHVMAARPSAQGENSQVALQFDHVELKGGQSVPVHSQIESITPAGGASTSGSALSAPPAGGSPSPSASGANGAGRASGAPQAAGGDSGAASAGNGSPAPGTVVARTGNIAIRTTSIPGVLVANNVAGQQDPRMGQSSGILLGAKQDIELDGGTQMVVGVSAASAGTQ